MTGKLSEKGRETAAIKAEKRAAALRENLKRRKAQSSNAATKAKGDDGSHAEPENRE